jgi:hypothetical protein
MVTRTRDTIPLTDIDRRPFSVNLFPPLYFIRVFIPSFVAVSLSLLYLLPSPLPIILPTDGA